MIAELKNGLKADRMSCNKFSATSSDSICTALHT